MDTEAGEGFDGAADDNPHEIAREIIAKRRTASGLPTLIRFRRQYRLWQDGGWLALDEEESRSIITRECEAHLVAAHKRDLDRLARGEIETQPKLKGVTTGLTANVDQALKSECLLGGELHPPCWLPGAGGLPMADIVPLRNGIAILSKLAAREPGAILPATPALFNLGCPAVAIEDPAAVPPPVEWLKFVGEVWPDDPATVDLLQEWLGYLLTADNSMEKIMLMVGRSRGGKGVICKVIKALIGSHGIHSPPFEGLGDRFAEADFVGKPVAVIEDMRFDPKKGDEARIVSLLLTSSGRPGVSVVYQKGKSSIQALIGTRIVIATNELPRLKDASGALAGRWSVLHFRKSFADREDRRLPDRIVRNELPGILLWAAEGWARLRVNGRFTQPAASAEVSRDLRAESSRVVGFLDARCRFEAGHHVFQTDLFRAWERHCAECGMKPGTANRLTRELKSARPDVFNDDNLKRRPKENGKAEKAWVGLRLLPDPTAAAQPPAWYDEGRESRTDPIGEEL